MSNSRHALWTHAEAGHTYPSPPGQRSVGPRQPEVEGDYLELETLVETGDDLPAALSDIRKVLAELGIKERDLTRELYTEAVAASRQTSQTSAAENEPAGLRFS